MRASSLRFLSRLKYTVKNRSNIHSFRSIGLKNSLGHYQLITHRIDKNLQAGVVIDDVVYEASKLLLPSWPSWTRGQLATKFFHKRLGPSAQKKFAPKALN